MPAVQHRQPRAGEVILLGLLAAYMAISIDLYLPGLPRIADNLDASAGAAQRTVSAFILGVAIGQFFYGPLSDRYGRRPPLMFGASLYVVATVGCAFATSIDVLIAGRFVQALGACAGLVISRAIVRDRYDHPETARIFSLLTLVIGVVPICAPLLGGFMLTMMSWRWLFGALTLFGVTLGLCTWWRLEESRSEATALLARTENMFGAYCALFRQRRIVGYTMTGALNGACFFTYISASPDIVIRYFHIPAEHFGWVFGLNAAGLIGMSQINRYILTSVTPDRILSIGSLAVVGFTTALLLCSATRAGGLIGVLGPLFLIVSTYGFVSANTTAGALSVDPARAGSIAALIGGANFGAGAAASAIAAWLSDGTPKPVAWVMLVASSLSAVSLHTLVLPRRKEIA